MQQYLHAMANDAQILLKPRITKTCVRKMILRTYLPPVRFQNRLSISGFGTLN